MRWSPSRRRPEVYVVGPPQPATDEVNAPRLILRDGSVADVSAAGPTDREAVRRFFHDLSPESRHRRFLSWGEPPDGILDRFSEAADPARAMTLLAWRRIGADRHIIAIASYSGSTADTAEISFAVDDQFHGKGLATAMLERLAAHATVAGFTRFEATTLADNAEMLDVFRDSGFTVRSRAATGCLEIELSLTSSADAARAAERREHVASVASLKPMLAPRAVAVVGASQTRPNIGRRILQALTGTFAGPVYAVHPGAAAIDAVPAVRTARDLPPGVEMAVIAVPPDQVPQVVDDCAAAGMKALVVITAGFAETGAEGRARQDALVAKARGYGMRLLGPNGMGLLNLDPQVRLHASFSPVVPPAGHVAFSSQSGALGIAILDLATQRGVGLSAFVSVGNKADVSSNDLLEYWEDDPNTSVVLLYLESFGNPRRFSRIARRVSRTKPIVALKAGRTPAGSRAAGSHTAALAATDTATDALFQQSGVIRVDTIDEMFDLAACLDAQPLPRGPRVAVVTNAGGPGILAADACVAAGLTLVDLSAETTRRMRAFLPASASVGNPIDMVASAGGAEFRQAVDTALTADETDALIVIFTPVDRSKTDEILAGIQAGIASARAAGAQDKTVLACLMAEAQLPRLAAGSETIPAYRFPENAARALAKALAYSRWRARPAGLFWSFDDLRVDEARAICRRALAARGAGWLTPDEVQGVLRAFGLPLAPTALAHTAEEAATLATVFGFPVAAKISSLRIQHKTDTGGVRLNLSNAEEVRQAFAGISSISGIGDGDINGVVIQPMVKGGLELTVGIAPDPVFGPLVGFGIGGVDVELVGDVRFRVAPLTDHDADDLLSEIRGARLLQGYRGRPGADMDALRELLLRVSRLAEDVHELAELDLNPVIALPPGQGCRIVDARISVR
jgi:acetate---CoA ligase (ADP-forming)